MKLLHRTWARSGTERRQPGWRLLAALLGLLLMAGPSVARAEEETGREGVLGGQVFDGDSGDPVPGVTVILTWPEPEDGSEARQAIETTDADGAYRFGSVPAGYYSVTFSKTGYRAAKMTRFEVLAGEVNRADFPLQPAPVDTADSVLELEAFVVEAEVVEDILNELELRMDSDQLLNVMSAEDFSKFAASDVADALKRVSGVNVVEGQFAIIRGLDDRYNSTLYNGAPVPSPDPDRQSVQLDLFPSDIVSNLIISKTFAPDLPSNSSGGAINILTHDYPERFEFKLSGGTGWNDNAVPTFLDFVKESATGVDKSGLSDTIESDYGGLLGGRYEIFGREVRLKLVGNRETDYETEEGMFEEREPGDPPDNPDPFGNCAVIPRFVFGVGFVCDVPLVVFPSDLNNGLLGLTGGRFEQQKSRREVQLTAYGGAGFDLDREGAHQIDGSVFYTRKKEGSVELRSNGFLPGVDLSELDPTDINNSGDFDDFVALPKSWVARSIRQSVLDTAADGPVFFTSFSESRAFERERDLRVYQANGDHDFGRLLEGLRASWAWNRSETNQNESVYGLRYFAEPPNAADVGVTDPPTDPTLYPLEFDDVLGPGPRCQSETGIESTQNCFVANNGILFSETSIFEEQDFFRFDGEFERGLFSWLTFSLKGGAWWEEAERDVQAGFLENVSVDGESNQFAIIAPTEEALGGAPFEDCDDGNCLDRDEDDVFQFVRSNTNRSERDIFAWHLNGKASFFDRLDLLAGLRRERIEIRSFNNPFGDGSGAPTFGIPRIFPSRFTLFDRLDNPDRPNEADPLNPFNEVDPMDPRVTDPDFAFNDQLLGIQVPMVPCPTADRPDRMCSDLRRGDLEGLLNGVIDEAFILPSYGVALRPLEGLTFRGAYSRTVARPSFRELGYYVTVETGTDDRTVGNPQVKLSPVESWDLRGEYVWGDLGDIVAVSLFKKNIDEPIERIVVRDPLVLTGDAEFRTFFNNPNTASLRGYEIEARKSLGFLSLSFLDRFDIKRPRWLKGFDFLQYLSVGGNFTKIDATVKRTDGAVRGAAAYFANVPSGTFEFENIEPERRLFNQPEWILNADISFDHPDWGTKLTLAYFEISDILDAAGTASLNNSGEPFSFTLDQYKDSFHQLDFIASQKARIEFLRADLTVKLSIKNLTDSTRRLIYDPNQLVDRIAEREYKKGRDYSLSFSWKWEW